jgi:DNA invertase Pin-like site-specific DNA recombinase
MFIMNIAIYSRVSTEKQDAENQLVVLRAFASKQGWTVVREYEDVITGGSHTRPAFDEMFAAAGLHEFELVLFWSLDRLSREGTEWTLRRLRELAECGVGYKSHEEQYLDTTNPLNEVFISFKAVMAVEEKKRISQRTKAGLAMARARGVVLGNRPVSVDTARLAELRAKGFSMRAIAAQLNVSKSTVALRLQMAVS